jgi:hypothetical protein
VLAPDVQRVAGDYGSGQLGDGVQQRLGTGDLVGCVLNT